VPIVESGSLVEASKQIYVAQPALSQQLAELEHEIGGPLLHRSSRGVVPTPSR
jgi:LysR family transcriptional regulator, regulatory protein for tcuABC